MFGHNHLSLNYLGFKSTSTLVWIFINTDTFLWHENSHNNLLQWRLHSNHAGCSISRKIPPPQPTSRLRWCSRWHLHGLHTVVPRWQRSRLVLGAVPALSTARVPRAASGRPRRARGCLCGVRLVVVMVMEMCKARGGDWKIPKGFCVCVNKSEKLATLSTTMRAFIQSHRRYS